MGESVIPLADLRTLATPARVPAQPIPATGLLSDRLGRPLRDLRISVTDRCNFRCSYCMPKEVFDRDYRFLPQSDLLSFEEITRIARLFVAHGVAKLRLTGGEPLLRKGLEALIAQLSALRTPGGEPLDITLTTNGTLLGRKAVAMQCDVRRRSLASHVRERFGPGVVLRFIEYMDVGATNGWRLDEVLPSAEVRARLHAAFPLEKLPPSAAGESAERWRYADGGGEVGFISSVTQAFCGDCNRARLSTEGKLFLCLFATRGHDLRSLLRQGRSDEDIASAIGLAWQERDDRYSELRGSGAAPPGSGGAHRHGDVRAGLHRIQAGPLGGGARGDAGRSGQVRSARRRHVDADLEDTGRKDAGQAAQAGRIGCRSHDGDGSRGEIGRFKPFRDDSAS